MSHEVELSYPILPKSAFPANVFVGIGSDELARPLRAGDFFVGVSTRNVFGDGQELSVRVRPSGTCETDIEGASIKTIGRTVFAVADGNGRFKLTVNKPGKEPHSEIGFIIGPPVTNLKGWTVSFSPKRI